MKPETETNHSRNYFRPGTLRSSGKMKSAMSMKEAADFIATLMSSPCWDTDGKLTPDLG